MASRAVCPFCEANIESEFPLCSSCGALLVGASVGATHFVTSGGSLPFVGRTKELEQIRLTAQKALAGSRQVLWISGQPGVGKTRLVAEAETEHLSQMSVFKVACLRHGFHIPFRTFADLFRKIAEIRLSDSAAISLRQIQSRLPVPQDFEIRQWDQRLLELMGWQSVNGNGIPCAERRRQTIESVKAALFSFCRAKPLCLVFEDVQWMDDSSVQLLGEVINASESLPMLICMTSRDPWRPIGEFPQNGMTRVAVPSIDFEEALVILKAVLDANSLPEFILDALSEQQEWTPLYIENLVRKLISQNIVQEGKDDWMRETPLDNEMIPRELVNLVQNRVSGLGEGIRQILEVGAVIGVAFTAELLDRLEVCSEGLREKIAMLEAMGFLARADEEDGLHYVLNHAVTQEVVYNSLIQDHKRAIHARVLQTLLSVYGDDDEAYHEMMAYHALHANLPEVALRYLEKCAQKARKQYANREALEFYGLTLALLVQSPALREHSGRIAEFLLKQAEVHRYIGEMEEAAADLQQASKVVQQVRNPLLEAQVALANALLDMSMGRSGQAKQDLDDAARILDSNKNARLSMELANLRGIFAWRMGRLDEAEESYRDVVEIGESLADLTYVANAYNNLGLIAYGKGELHKAFQLHSKALKLRQRSDDLWGQAASHNNLGIVFENNSHQDSAESEYLQALNLARATGFRELETAVLANLGQFAENKGQMPQAFEYNSRSLDLAINLGDKRSQAIALDNLGNAHFLSGNLARAQDNHREALDIAESLNDGDVSCRALLGLCFDMINGGKTDEAESLCDRAEQLASQLGFKETRPRIYRARAELLLARGDAPGARKEADKAMKCAQQMHLRAEEARACALWNKVRLDKNGNGIGTEGK